MNQAHDLTVLVLAPTGRDASLLVSLIEHQGMEARAIDAATSLLALEDQCGGTLLVAEEALTPAFIGQLGPALERQPTWADSHFLF